MSLRTNDSWAPLCRPAKPILAQFQGQRKSLESATEMSVVYWIEGILRV